MSGWKLWYLLDGIKFSLNGQFLSFESALATRITKIWVNIIWTKCFLITKRDVSQLSVECLKWPTEPRVMIIGPKKQLFHALQQISSNSFKIAMKWRVSYLFIICLWIINEIENTFKFRMRHQRIFLIIFYHHLPKACQLNRQATVDASFKFSFFLTMEHDLNATIS